MSKTYRKMGQFESAMLDQWVAESCVAAPLGVVTLVTTLWRAFQSKHHRASYLFGPIRFAEHLAQTYPSEYHRKRRYLRGIRLRDA